MGRFQELLFREVSFQWGQGEVDQRLFRWVPQADMLCTQAFRRRRCQLGLLRPGLSRRALFLVLQLVPMHEGLAGFGGYRHG
jgi:hypothetical protein